MMSSRQKVAAFFYPVLMWVGSIFGKSKSRQSTIPAYLSIYTLSVEEAGGTIYPVSTWKGKKILVVNTASDCGYTRQYEQLQSLYEQYNRKLIILAFPSNDFKEQEKADDDAIGQFCQRNYGVTFPVMKKSIVVKQPGQNELFQWLTETDKNGWNNGAPVWNFTKYVIDEVGNLRGVFPPSVSPVSKEFLKALK